MIIKLLLGNRTEKSKNLNYKLQRIHFLRKTDLPPANDFIKYILVHSSINDGRNNLFFDKLVREFCRYCLLTATLYKTFRACRSQIQIHLPIPLYLLKSRNFHTQEWKPFCRRCVSTNSSGQPQAKYIKRRRQ